MMQKELFEIIAKFKGCRIAVIGDIALDSYVCGNIKRLNPESAAPLLTANDGGEKYRLGCAANVALNCKTLGADVDLYGLLGNEENASQVERLCKEIGINLITAREGATLKKQRFIEKGHGHYLIRIDFGESDLKPISETSKSFLLFHFQRKLLNYHAIILSDYNKRVLRGGMGAEIISLANSAGILSVVDPKPANNITEFRDATVVRPNLSEARLIVSDHEASLQELARQLKEKLRSKFVVITCGKDGIITYGEGFNHIPTKARQVVDVSGAGDTVAAALTLSLISGAGIVQASQIANYAAGIVVEKQGTSSVTPDELIKRISEEQ
jgi:D-beta-D-heptose 7-phosphate kinase/D-beta-D-heptose 1-phosphate adenosyltransferase